ncbi:NF-X1-type zinc finger protein NFXL1 isoform X1 [Neodiprion pinetum]|uniref:NF-X1-type zinc finger protein NFXL1 isoform X1 n=2 Tax=Neodiprion pinetum TaxID=441929 RepID=UPI001EDD614F|nr:NF-X1-type zinc finger protein NFXL1 isoform X1 [Neodiprion pinetum]XP_046470529.1 NF-X1-type zinc finger protein NFXL1 isoform X1 [Neodiprion pinetum]
MNSGFKMKKFKRAQAQNQAAIERHMVTHPMVESSSDEEDETGQEILEQAVGKVLTSYQDQGGDPEKILSYLADTFQSNGAVCLICISSVKKTDAIWSCTMCYSFMHLPCIQHWIRDSLAYKRDRGISQLWACPKCRTEYAEDEAPQHYECFCGKTRDPSYQPWCVPHSCGEACGKLLQPKCGHSCVLLCHPGPCPPCPKMVSSKCYCAKSAPRPRRCNAKEWSCGAVCSRNLKCGKHTCREMCHSGECPPCPEKVSATCHCGNKTELRPCFDTVWRCDKPCRKSLSCNVHVCQDVCHLPGDCGDCLTAKNRSCPCGKRKYKISCKQEAATCGDTCEKLLDCGAHYCNKRCHLDSCGQCLEVVTKSCKCGAHKKEIACAKVFHCDTKCKQIRLCGRHPCNKKCCDCVKKNNFNPCEKTCDRTLSCRKHKCSAPCHSGPCYPCQRTDTIQCRCGSSKIVIPCGTAKKIKPPHCNKMCKIPPICHHPKRESHKCHQGQCPPCKKQCALAHKKCGHICPVPCHTKVWVKVNGITQPAGPWEKQRDKMQLKTLPCPPCQVSVMVTCLGGHETLPWPCHKAVSSCCQRPCGQLLSCTNHTCMLLCHVVQASGDNGQPTPCEECEKPCVIPRPQGCTHTCPSICHPAPCKPCKQIVRLPCHCSINTLYIRCSELTSANEETKKEMFKCGNQCPKNYPCGHRCIDDCHPGLCERAEECNKKVKIWCKCKRLKKDISCRIIRSGGAVVECDAVCQEKKKERIQAQEAEAERKKREEELRNQREVEKFERKFKPRRKCKDKTNNEPRVKETKFNYLKWLAAILVFAIACLVAFYSVDMQMVPH